MHSGDKLHDLPEWCRPKVRLFLSADIVGSTAYKQRSFSKGEEAEPRRPGSVVERERWFKAVLGFYQTAWTELRTHWGVYSQQCPSEYIGEQPRLWKAVGDEVLFQKVITHPAQILYTLDIWIKVLRALSSNLRRGDSLDVKSCAWLGEFPVRDHEVVIQTVETASLGADKYIFSNCDAIKRYYDALHSNQDSGTVGVLDFIGPSIDTGFRLGQFASPRKLVVSIELANALSREYRRVSDYQRGATGPAVHTFGYEGRCAIKGVLGGEPYPVLWIDLAKTGDIHAIEDRLLSRDTCSLEDVFEFTEQFVCERRETLVHQYLCTTEKVPEEYTTASPRYIEYVLEWAEQWKQFEQHKALELESIGSKDLNPNLESSESPVVSIPRIIQRKEAPAPAPPAPEAIAEPEAPPA